MKIKFTNGVVKECTAPTEQKLFKNVEGETVSAGWVLIFRIIGNITSSELDSILASDLSELNFLSETEEGEEKALFSLTGYSKVTSSTIRHAEDTASTYAEIQMSKGV